MAHLHQLHDCSVKELQRAIILAEALVPHAQRTCVVLDVGMGQKYECNKDMCHLLGIHFSAVNSHGIVVVHAGVREYYAHILERVPTRAQKHDGLAHEVLDRRRLGIREFGKNGEIYQ